MPLMTHSRGVSLELSGFSWNWDIGASLREGGPCVLLDAQSLLPLPYWAELDFSSPEVTPDNQVSFPPFLLSSFPPFLLSSFSFLPSFFLCFLAFFLCFLASLLASFVPSFVPSFLLSFLASFFPLFLALFLASSVPLFLALFLAFSVPCFLRSLLCSFLRPSSSCFFLPFPPEDLMSQTSTLTGAYDLASEAP